MDPSRPDADDSPADDAQLLLLPLGLLAAGLGIGAVLLALHLMPSASADDAALEQPTTAFIAAPSA